MDTFKVFESSTLDELEKQVENRLICTRLVNNRLTQIGKQQVNPDW